MAIKELIIGAPAEGIPAGTINAVIRELNRLSQFVPDARDRSKQPVARDTLVVKARNDTESEIEYGFVVALSTTAATYDEKPSQVFDKSTFTAVKNDSLLTHAIFAVSTSHVKTGDVGNFIIAGPAWCRWDRTSEHHEFATLKPDQATYESAAASSDSGIPVLRSELDQETGSMQLGEQWALVLLRGGGGGGGGAPITVGTALTRHILNQGHTLGVNFTPAPNSHFVAVGGFGFYPPDNVSPPLDIAPRWVNVSIDNTDAIHIHEQVWMADSGGVVFNEGLDGELTTRTDADTGKVTLTVGQEEHRPSIHQFVTVTWSGGSRQKMLVTGFEGTNNEIVLIDGGSGDDLPAASTSVNLDSHIRWFVPANAQTGTLTTRSDDDTGKATLDNTQHAHGMVPNTAVDLTWSGGSRTGMTVGVLSGNDKEIINLDGGTGDPLPTTSTAVTVTRPEVETTWFMVPISRHERFVLEITSGTWPAASGDTPGNLASVTTAGRLLVHFEDTLLEVTSWSGTGLFMLNPYERSFGPGRYKVEIPEGFVGSIWAGYLIASDADSSADRKFAVDGNDQAPSEFINKSRDVAPSSGATEARFVNFEVVAGDQFAAWLEVSDLGGGGGGGGDTVAAGFATDVEGTGPQVVHTDLTELVGAAAGEFQLVANVAEDLLDRADIALLTVSDWDPTKDQLVWHRSGDFQFETIERYDPQFTQSLVHVRGAWKFVPQGFRFFKIDFFIPGATISGDTIIPTVLHGVTELVEDPATGHLAASGTAMLRWYKPDSIPAPPAGQWYLGQATTSDVAPDLEPVLVDVSCVSGPTG